MNMPTQSQRDQRSWEVSQMDAAGIHIRRTVQTQFEEETNEQIHIQVIETTPPFLNANIKYTKQVDPVSVVKDPTSDIAVLARNGSQLVSEMRMKREQMKAKQALKINPHSMLGTIIGVKEETNGL